METATPKRPSVPKLAAIFLRRLVLCQQSEETVGCEAPEAAVAFADVTVPGAEGADGTDVPVPALPNGAEGWGDGGGAEGGSLTPALDNGCAPAPRCDGAVGWGAAGAGAAVGAGGADGRAALAIAGFAGGALRGRGTATAEGRAGGALGGSGTATAPGAGGGAVGRATSGGALGALKALL